MGMDNLKQFLTDTANAIRSKTGKTIPIKASDIPSEILTIQTTGNTGIIPSGTLNITENLTYDVTQYATAIVNVKNNWFPDRLDLTGKTIGFSGSYSDFVKLYDYLLGVHSQGGETPIIKIQCTDDAIVICGGYGGMDAYVGAESNINSDIYLWKCSESGHVSVNMPDVILGDMVVRSITFQCGEQGDVYESAKEFVDGWLSTHLIIT